MSSRRKKNDAQSSLFGSTVEQEPEPARRTRKSAPPPLPPPEAMHGYADQFAGEDFPSTLGGAPAQPFSDDAPDRPKLRLVPAATAINQPEFDVIVEATGDGRFWVTRVRDHGTTSAQVLYTRRELEMLVARARAALEVG